MKIIGRERERDILRTCLGSDRPEFVVVLGRRRVGKTYLIKEFFNGQFSFYATGMSDGKTSSQLKAFHTSLKEYGCKDRAKPGDWFEAFQRLKKLLMEEDVYRDPVSNKRVVFIDELPWMDTPRSDFKSALEFFWNSWGSTQEDLLLIVCGSATFWIINHLLKDRKGFHNRITRRIRLAPFSLCECEQLLENNGVIMTRQQIIESYMVFGGIPYYLNLLDVRLSLYQNVEQLCFRPYGEFRDEYTELFHSLFKKPEKHLEVIKALCKSKKRGLTRNEIIENTSLVSGAALTNVLEELEQCGFIRSYANYAVNTRGHLFQLIDPFVIFSIKFMQDKKIKSWNEYIHSSAYNSWRGNAFEIVCLNHISEIKAALGIAGVETSEYAWKSRNSDPGAQIDLLIDRNDGIINLCEMKYTDGYYEVNKSENEKLLNRLSVLKKEVNQGKAIHLTLISANGLKRNMYSSVFQSIITGDELFKRG
ncbi:MAG: AAA family ATPase [Lachnospiraceae bacterium]|nr:AAA family ATPase [Lachnospiraceae bacterium]